MKIKFLCSKLEFKLKEKFPEIPLVEVYYARRRNYIHFAFEKMPSEFERKNEFLKEIEKFYNIYLRKDFTILNPMRLINTIKWKYDYIVFRKRK